MGFQYRFAPFNDLLVLDRELAKFLDQSLFGYDLIGAEFHKQR